MVNSVIFLLQLSFDNSYWDRINYFSFNSLYECESFFEFAAYRNQCLHRKNVSEIQNCEIFHELHTKNYY